MVARGGDYTQWSPKDSVAAAQTQFGDFCATVARLSDANPPSAPNAANGFFRDAMWSGKELAPLAAPYPKEDSEADGKALYALNSAFGQQIKNAFQPENYSASGWTNGKLFIQMLEQLGAEIVPVITDIGKLFIGNPDVPGTITHINALIDKTKNLGVKLNGAHANGWIQPNVTAVAINVKSQADGLASSLQSAEGKKVAQDISAVCDRIAKIPKFDNNPWLYAEWQLEFQAIMSSAGRAASPNAVVTAAT